MALVNGSPIGLLISLTYAGIADAGETPVTPPAVAEPTTWTELADVTTIWTDVKST